jgi:hypothetical protein
MKIYNSHRVILFIKEFFIYWFLILSNPKWNSSVNIKIYHIRLNVDCENKMLIGLLKWLGLLEQAKE